MNKYIYLVSLLLLVLPYRLLASEVSAFGAGNLNSSSPYGLSSDEKIIYSNKVALKKIKAKFFVLKNQIDSLQERIDGLQTVIEGMGQLSSKNKASIHQLTKKISLINTNEEKYQLNTNNNINQNLQSIKDINQTLSNTKSTVNDINTSFVTKTRLNLLINKVNTNYATKHQLQQLANDINNFKSLMLKMLKNQHQANTSNKLSNMKNSMIYTDAYNFFIKHQYAKASKYYLYLVKKNYMAATSNYMLGEINYFNKNYANAIAFYKASALLYNKSKFMPTLMLHTALSMSKTGDIAGAKKFLRVLIAKYPSSKEALKAKNSLKLLKS